MAYLLVALIIASLSACYLSGKRKKEKKEINDFFITTESQSNERVKNLNLDKPSEDASYILDTGQLVLQKYEPEPYSTMYAPRPDLEWIIILKKSNGNIFTKDEVNQLFDLKWRQNFNSTIYGYSAEEKRVTFANAGDGPNTFTELQVAISLLKEFQENPCYKLSELQAYIDELQLRIKKSPDKIEIRPELSAEEAEAKSKELSGLYNEFNHDAIIVLRANTTYSGPKAWDALICTGLQWGDGDLFHWNHQHDQLFSVWTTTNPGYFFPEEIIAGTMNPHDLIFGFSIPRSKDAEHIFKAMFETVSYCQKRLGGTILDKNMQPFDTDKESAEITALIKKMKEKDIMPGSTKALRMF